MEAVDVRATRGIWISRLEHIVFYLGRTGDERGVEAALAGTVLAWEEDGLGYRLEGGFNRDRAVELASELR